MEPLTAMMFKAFRCGGMFCADSSGSAALLDGDDSTEASSVSSKSVDKGILPELVSELRGPELERSM